MANLNQLGASFSAQFQNLNGRHPGQWPVVPRILCCLGVLLGVLVISWFGYLEGQQEELNNGEAEEQKLRDDYKMKVQQAINLNALREQKKQVSEYVTTLEKQLPSKAEMDALLSDINQAGLGRGLQFDLFKPGQVVVKNYYAELPIEIKVAGNYHDIGSFTSDIAKLPRIVTLNNLNLSTGKDGALALEAVAKTFRYLDKDEVEAQRKAAAEKKNQGAKK